MARADLLCDLVKYGLNNDNINFRKAVEAISASERAKQHGVLANKLEEMLRTSSRPNIKDASAVIHKNGNGENIVMETIPTKKMSQLLLPKSVVESCNDLLEEHMRSDILRSFGLEPRNKILLIGPPGNGKTSLAEAVAESLMLPLLTVKYENLVGSYLGETASRLAKLFDYVRTRRCVLFFDEFETLGKKRGDTHETGEIKRVVSTLLLQIDALPSYVIAIAATNHEELLDKAAWRRFQLRLILPSPTRDNLRVWFENFEKRANFSFGLATSTLAKKLYGKSYAEAEEFALSVYRQFVLRQPDTNARIITQSQLSLLASQANIENKKSEEDEG